LVIEYPNNIIEVNHDLIKFTIITNKLYIEHNLLFKKFNHIM